MIRDRDSTARTPIRQMPAIPRPQVRRGWALVAATVALLIVVYWLRLVLLPFVLAAALAFVTTPVVNFLAGRLPIPRWSAALIVYVGLLGALSAMGYWLVSVIVPQATTLGRNAPQLMDALFKQLAGSEQIHLLGMQIDAKSVMDSGLSAIRNWIGGPAQALAGGIAVLMMGFLTLLLVLFFLLSGPGLAEGALHLLPPSSRPTAMLLARALRPVLLRYIFGVLIVVVVTGTLSWIGFGWLLGLPHAALLSVAVGILETIPLVGPAASAVLVGLVAVTTGKVGVVIGVILCALSLRLFVDQLFGPIVLGQAVKLHPAVVLFALLAGGAIYGVLGVLLAVPVAASVKVVLQTFYGETSQTS